MQLLIAIVQEEDADAAIGELIARKFAVTKMATFGGYLKTGNTTLLLAVDEDQLNEATQVLEQYCGRREQTSSKQNGGKATIGGGVVFRLKLDGMTRL